MDDMTNKFILNFTPTGMIPTKEMTPHVPTEPPEIVEQVLEAIELGANMAHLHARDQEGRPTYKKEIYAEIIYGIRKKNKHIPICVSTSGRNWSEFERRSECLELTGDVKPDFGSLTLSSLNFNKQASLNAPEMIIALAEKMRENGIRPELEAFDLGMINYAQYLIKKRLIAAPYYFNLILGNIACAQANMLSLGLMIKELPAGAYWSVGGIGEFQLPMNAASIVFGGGVRVGLEDNLYWDAQRTRLATNSELVNRVVGVARVMDAVPYTCQEARRVVGLT
jgi:uncharacterized protein (DUF849 family)